MPITINGTGPIDGITSLNTTVSSTELGYLDGVTSALQTQINIAGGLVKITDNTFSAQSTVSINNCFTSTYNNYRITLEFSAASTALTVQMRMRSSGSDNTTSNYTRQIIYANSTSVVGGITSNANNWGIMSTDATYGGHNCFQIDINGPQLTKHTTMSSAYMFVASGGTVYTEIDGWLFNATTSFDGFSLLTTTGNISGTVRVYGYRN